MSNLIRTACKPDEVEIVRYYGHSKKRIVYTACPDTTEGIKAAILADEERYVGHTLWLERPDGSREPLRYCKYLGRDPQYKNRGKM